MAGGLAEVGWAGYVVGEQHVTGGPLAWPDRTKMVALLRGVDPALPTPPREGPGGTPNEPGFGLTSPWLRR